MKNKSTKNVPTRLAASAAMLMLTVGVFGSSQALAGIASTKHNLGSNQDGNNAFTPNVGTAELCVFCHTPHGADTTAAVPLWNRKLAAPATYTTYNSLGTSSLDGATAPVGSVSIACLSCHDGVQAMNTMINQPGSGGYNAAGATWAGTWTGSRVDTSTGKLPAGQISNIGQDLRNDHPIGIQYGGGMPGGAGVAFTAGAIADGALRDPDFKGVQYSGLNNNKVWWVDTSAGAAGSRQKTDMLLYTRENADSVNKDGSLVAGALVGAQAFVECASCHDPHSENTTFLRIQNTGSAVCLACHTK